MARNGGRITGQAGLRIVAALVFLGIMAMGIRAGAAEHKIQKHRASMLAVSLGGGRVALFWPPALEFYNGGGWVLLDKVSGKTLIRWSRKDLAKGLASLPAERQEKLRPFLKELGRRGNKKAKSLISWLLVGAMADFNMAQGLGMGCLLKGVPRGKRSYRLVILNKKRQARGQGADESSGGWMEGFSPPFASWGAEGQDHLPGCGAFLAETQGPKDTCPFRPGGAEGR